MTLIKPLLANGVSMTNFCRRLDRLTFCPRGFGIIILLNRRPALVFGVERRLYFAVMADPKAWAFTMDGDDGPTPISVQGRMSTAVFGEIVAVLKLEGIETPLVIAPNGHSYIETETYNQRWDLYTHRVHTVRTVAPEGFRPRIHEAFSTECSEWVGEALNELGILP